MEKDFKCANKTKKNVFSKAVEFFRGKDKVIENTCYPASGIHEWVVHAFDKDGNLIASKPINASCECPFTIGRDKNCDLVLDSKFVGNVHLKIGKDDWGYFAKDFSISGTQINGKVYNNESFSLEEGFALVADVQIYFERNKNCSPVFSRELITNAEEAVKTRKFDGISKTKESGNNVGNSEKTKIFKS